MKKCLAILAMLVITTVTGYPQPKIRKSVFGANAGIALPVDQFAGNTFIRDAGFALAGPATEADWIWYGKFFGFSSTIGYSTFFFNEMDYLSEYDRILSGIGTNIAATGNYHVIKFLIGFTLKTPEFRSTEILLRFHVGAATSFHPEVTVTNTELGVVNSIVQSRSGGPASSAILQVNHWLSDRYGLSLSSSISSTIGAFHDETGPEGYFLLPVHFVNINLGFVMNLKAPRQ